MKARLIVSIVTLVTMATLFTPTTHAQLPYGYPGPYARYYGPYGYPPPIRCCYAPYAPVFGIRIGGGARSETSSGISFQFNGIPEALLQVIKNSNVVITGKKIHGNKGAAGNYYSNKNGHYLAVPPGTYDVAIQLPNNSITIQNVLVNKGQVVALALPIYNLTGPLPQASPTRPPYTGSRINPIPLTKPMVQ